MGRAELRRQAREKLSKQKTYTLTVEQIEDMKRKATDEALDTAFILMLGLPVMVVHDKFSKLMRKEKRLENLADEILELYDLFKEGRITLDEIIATIKEETGVDITRREKKGG